MPYIRMLIDSGFMKGRVRFQRLWLGEQFDKKDTNTFQEMLVLGPSWF